MAEAANKTCQGCNTEILPDDIAQRRAGLVQGVLLCPRCVEQKRQAATQPRPAATPAAASPAEQSSPAGAGAAPPIASSAPSVKNDVDEVISLVTDDEMPSSKSQMIRSFATGSTLGGAHHDEKLKRPIGGPQDAATRIRTFHCKLTDAGLANMDDTINEWLDNHPNIYIKSVTSSVGVYESKTKESHLFIAMFY